MFAEEQIAPVAAPPGVATAPKAGKAALEEDPFLDAFVGFCLLPAGLDPEGGTSTLPESVAIRHGWVQEWLTEAVAHRAVVSEAEFMAWLAGASTESSPAPLPETLQKLLAGDVSGAPPCRGALLYAPLAVAAVHWQPVRTFRSFYAFSSMDRGVERAVTGLLASLLAQAVSAQPYRAGLGAWVSSCAGRLLQSLRKVPFPGAEEEAGVERHSLEKLEEILWDVAERFSGGKAEDWNAQSLLGEVQRLSCFEDQSGFEDQSCLENTGHEAGTDSLLVLALLAAALELGGTSPRASLKLLDAPRQVCRCAHSLAIDLLGAWYGRTALEEEFEIELERGENLLWRALRLEARTQGALLTEVSGLLKLPDTFQTLDSQDPSS